MTQLNSTISPHRPSNNKYLYHYTTLNALLSILDTDCLWASDLGATSDPADLVYIRELSDRVCLAEMLPQSSTPNEVLRCARPTNTDSAGNDRGTCLPGYISISSLGLSSGSQHKAFEFWRLALERVFGVSFCLKRDLLSQWRGYGLAGSGVCIAFDQESLFSDFGVDVELVKFEYTPELQMHRIQAFIKRAFARYRGVMNGIPITFSIYRNGPDDIAIQAGFESVAADIAREAHTFKKPGFSEEEEYRLIILLPQQSEQTNEVNLRVKGNSLLPYVVLSSRNGKLPIREIIHGPANGCDYSDYALIAFLNRKGYPSVKISKSKYSLR